MKKQIWISMLALTTILAACGHKKSADQPEETRESMTNLQEVESSSCPVLQGTYTCAGDNSNEDLSVAIQPVNALGKKIVFAPENPDKQTFMDFLVENYALDAGGFIADGKVHNKTEEVRKGIQQLLQVAAYVVVPPMLKSLAFDLKAEIKRVDLNNFRIGYSAGCQDSQVVLHYVAGPSATKMKIEKIASDQVAVTVFSIEENGPVTKQSEICRFKNSEVRLRKPLSETLTDTLTKVATDLGTSLTESINKSWDYPGSMNVEVTDSNKLTGDEIITFRFDRYGWITNRNLYTLKKAFLGPTDDYMWDDVTIVQNRKGLTINMDTKEVLTNTPGNRQEKIGKVTGTPPNLKLILDKKTTYTPRTLTIE